MTRLLRFLVTIISVYNAMPKRGSLQIKSAGNLGGMLVGEGAGAGGAGSAVGRGDRGLGGGATALVSIPAAAGRGQHQHVSVGATAETPQQNTFTPAPVMLTFVAHADVEGWHVKDEGARVVVEGVGSGHLSFVGIHATKGTPVTQLLPLCVCVFFFGVTSWALMGCSVSRIAISTFSSW